MGQSCKDYEIRLHRGDGTLSLVALVSAKDEAEAKCQAEMMLKLAHLTNAYIWDDEGLVKSLYRLE